MVVQVLVAAMNQKDHSLLDKMNIQSDAIVGNQGDKNKIEEFIYKGKHKIKYLSFKEKGVGLNRNNTLMRATGEFCLIADDDMFYVDEYEKIVIDYFEKYPEADVIIFNLREPSQVRYVNKKVKRIYYHNFMRYGAARIAFRRESVTKKGIFFNLHFGGGADYSSGEDTLFLHSCLKKGLNILAVPTVIAELLDDRESTWFEGYTIDYYYDKGVLFGTMSKGLSKLLCLQFAVRQRHNYQDTLSFKKVLNSMLAGAKSV